jgi:hypothetical protein
VNLPRPTVAFMNELASRRASEVELYQRFGFPDYFTYYGRDWPEHSLSIQHLGYAHRDCEVLVHGSQVLGHPHAVHENDDDWDGVRRPGTYRGYRTHLQTLGDAISLKSPLGWALDVLERRKLGPGVPGREWCRMLDFWAMTRTTSSAAMESLVKNALVLLAPRFASHTVVCLRLAAEHIGPGFAKQTLVAAGRWPPSRQGITAERLSAARPADVPGNHTVHCRATGEYIGKFSDLWSSYDDGLFEEELFAEVDRDTSWPVGAVGSRYVVTGDGHLFRQEKHGWRGFGPLRDAVVIRPPRAQRRRAR